MTRRPSYVPPPSLGERWDLFKLKLIRNTVCVVRDHDPQPKLRCTICRRCRQVISGLGADVIPVTYREDGTREEGEPTHLTDLPPTRHRSAP